jgi:hypothetical protein
MNVQPVLRKVVGFHESNSKKMVDMEARLADIESDVPVLGYMRQEVGNVQRLKTEKVIPGKLCRYTTPRQIGSGMNRPIK